MGLRQLEQIVCEIEKNYHGAASGRSQHDAYGAFVEPTKVSTALSRLR